MNARDERPAGAKPLHLNVIGGKRVPAADDRTIDVRLPVRRQALRGDRALRRRRHRCRGEGGARRVRRRLGAAHGDGARPAAAAARRGGRGARRRARRARVPGHRQADLSRPRRHRRDGALFRVLRLGRRQGPRRDHPVPQRLYGRGGARSARRHRPHRAVELPERRSSAARSGRRLPAATPASSSPPRTPGSRSSASPSSRSRSAFRRAR